MELLNSLVSQLGISEEQAKGGAGLLFKMVKEKLGADEFSQVQDAVPEANDMISAAPESGGGIAGMIGGLASKLGGGQLGDLASLAAGFKDLKLDSSMIAKFIPLILSFVQEKGGDTVKALLEKVMK